MRFTRLFSLHGTGWSHDVSARRPRAGRLRQAASTRPYFPARGEWRRQDPAAAGFDKAKLDAAVAFAVAHENPDTKDLAVAIPNQFRNEAPYNTLIGPTQPRGGASGIIVRHGSVVAEWG